MAMVRPGKFPCAGKAITGLYEVESFRPRKMGGTESGRKGGLPMKVEIMSKSGTKIVDLNRRRAIREKCLNCSAWAAPGVSGCPHTDCQLFPFRMGTGRQNAQERSRAIRDYCLWCMAGKAKEVPRCVSKLCPLFAFRKSGIDRSVECPSLLKK